MLYKHGQGGLDGASGEMLYKHGQGGLDGASGDECATDRVMLVQMPVHLVQ